MEKNDCYKNRRILIQIGHNRYAKVANNDNPTSPQIENEHFTKQGERKFLSFIKNDIENSKFGSWKLRFFSIRFLFYCLPFVLTSFVWNMFQEWKFYKFQKDILMDRFDKWRILRKQIRYLQLYHRRPPDYYYGKLEDLIEKIPPKLSERLAYQRDLIMNKLNIWLERHFPPEGKYLPEKQKKSILEKRKERRQVMLDLSNNIKPPPKSSSNDEL